MNNVRFGWEVVRGILTPRRAGLILVVALSAGCDDTTLFNGPPAANPFNPPPQAAPLTVDAGDDLFATEEQKLTLTAVASGGLPPYGFRWNLEQVPDDPNNPFDGGIPVIPDSLKPEIETLDFAVGRFVYRVRVTDRAGDTATDFVRIDVGPTPLRASVAELENEDDTLMAVAAVPFTLTAQTNMTGDFSYSWSQISGADVIFSDTSADVVEVTSVEPGDVVLQLRVRDTGNGNMSTIQINVSVEQGDAFLVRVDEPDLLLLDAPGTLTADITNDAIDPDALSYTWEITNNADATLSAPDARTTQITGHSLNTIALRVTASGTVNGTQQQASRDVDVVVLRDLAPQFDMNVVSTVEGVSGLIRFEFDAAATPKTVANIVRYIDDGFYNGLLWHRVARANGDPFVAQFGGFRRDGEDLIRVEPTRDPVESEADNSLGSDRGTVGLALVGGDTASGTSQIFVNMADNAFLDAQGFTSFGRVIDGLDRIDAMFDVDLGTENADDGTTLSDVPVDNITIIFIRRVDMTSVDRQNGASASTAGAIGNRTETDGRN